MKIGVVSLYYKSHNLGGLLQSYAVVALLNEYGFEAEQICYDLSISNAQSRMYQRNRRKKLLLSSGFKIVYSKLKGKISRIMQKPSNISNELKKQLSVFQEFEEFIPHSTVVYNIDTISEANATYDAFVVGSDQVWNLGQLAHDAMYLGFADPSKKKITYAVSMGKASITSYEKPIFLSKISNFSEISVREQSLGKLISSISNIQWTSVLDPTLLLSYDQWKTIENLAVLPNDRYIFCYFLGDCKWQRKFVQNYADSNGLRIIDIPYVMGIKRKSDSFLKSDSRFDVGPREFIALIKNAECVFTDSFHAVAFSVNFQTSFYVFDRDGLSGIKSINSRITDFLDSLSLSNRRIVTDKCEISNEAIDWEQVDTILKRERIKSREWLKHQLLS